MSWGFKNFEVDNFMIIYDDGTCVVVLLTYIDSILIIGSSTVYVQWIITKLNDMFSLKNIGELGYFLGIEVTRIEGFFHLNQQKYVAQLLDKVQLTEVKVASTLLALGKNMSKYDGQPLTNVDPYRSIEEALHYGMLTRPNIAFSVNKLC